MNYHCLYIFFFQAEDGIRDGTVTGVQTCALPIWVGRPLAQQQRRADLEREAGRPAPDLALAVELEAAEVVDGTRLGRVRSEEHTSELQSQFHLVCRLLLEKKKSQVRPDVD